MTREDYLYYKAELLKRKTYPYLFSDQGLAAEFSELLKMDGIKVSVIPIRKRAYICIDKRAVRRVLENIEKEIIEAQALIGELETARKEIADILYPDQT